MQLTLTDRDMDWRADRSCALADEMFDLLKQQQFEMLSLFPSKEAIERGDKDYHAAVNIAAQMHARAARWAQGGW